MSDRMPIDKISLGDEFAAFTDAWSPRIVGELNAQYVQPARLRGGLVWHHHEHAQN